jgi:hypothetical protein
MHQSDRGKSKSETKMLSGYHVVQTRTLDLRVFGKLEGFGIEAGKQPRPVESQAEQAGEQDEKAPSERCVD